MYMSGPIVCQLTVLSFFFYILTSGYSSLRGTFVAAISAMVLLAQAYVFELQTSDSKKVLVMLNQWLRDSLLYLSKNFETFFLIVSLFKCQGTSLLFLMLCTLQCILKNSLRYEFLDT